MTEPQTIQAQYLSWRLRRRSNGVYQADGRGHNGADLGRRSLGTRSLEEARKQIYELDRHMAVKLGIVTGVSVPIEMLGLEDGRKQYLDWVARSQLTGGASLKSQKRYRAVLAKFIPFLRKKGVSYWQHVNKRLIEAYITWLENEGYAYATLYLEATTIKQTLKALRDELGIEGLQTIKLKMKKASESTTYCYRKEEVDAMLAHCREDVGLHWFGGVIVGLIHTGMRISELASLRLSDVDFDNGIIRLADASRHGSKAQRATARTTKGRRSREFPLHDQLRVTLEQMDRHASGVIYHGPHGGNLKPDTVRNVLLRDVITPLKARFPASSPNEPSFADGRVHSFRHYFCSVCANNNTPEQLLMTWLGHHDSKMVQRYYHADRALAADQMNRITFATPAPEAA